MKIQLRNAAKFALVAGVATLALMPELAFAQAAASNIAANTSVNAGNLSKLLVNMQTQTAAMPNLIAWFSYIIGVAFAAFGIFKLKQHADNAAQNKLGPALGVLTVGGAFLALPGVTAAITGSNKLITAATAYQDGQF